MSERELNAERKRIAERLKARREELGISQAALAELSGMGIATIKRIESARFWINLKQYVILRKALNMPECWHKHRPP